MIIDFGKLWTTMIFINIAVLIANFSGVFPEAWTVHMAGIMDAYQKIQAQLSAIQNLSGENILIQAGAYGYVLLLGLQIAIQIIVLAPYYTGQTLNNLFAGVGFPAPIGTAVMLISYFSFIVWAVDLVRGGRLNEPY